MRKSQPGLSRGRKNSPYIDSKNRQDSEPVSFSAETALVFDKSSTQIKFNQSQVRELVRLAQEVVRSTDDNPPYAHEAVIYIRELKHLDYQLQEHRQSGFSHKADKRNRDVRDKFRKLQQINVANLLKFLLTVHKSRPELLGTKGLETLSRYESDTFNSPSSVPLENTPTTDNNAYVTSVRGPHDLAQLLKVACDLTAQKAEAISTTAWKAVINAIIDNPRSINDPVTGLELPPKPRDIDFQSRGKAPSGRRMTYDEYLLDPAIGWGEYTRHHLLLSSWLNELDRPLYQALMYQANKQADECGTPPSGPLRVVAQDDFFFRHGILTPGHLVSTSPAQGVERQVKLLTFVRKLQTPILTGRRSDGSLTRS